MDCKSGSLFVKLLMTCGIFYRRKGCADPTIRTEVVDSQIHNIILYVAEVFSNQAVFEKSKELEGSILGLEGNPYLGVIDNYNKTQIQ